VELPESTGVVEAANVLFCSGFVGLYGVGVEFADRLSTGSIPSSSIFYYRNSLFLWGL